MIGAPRIQRRHVDAQAGVWPGEMPDVLRRVYAARGVTTPHDIEHRLADLVAPHTLGGMRAACELLESALLEDTHIVIVGDFDADGATGTAVAIRGLQAFGARRIDYGIPNRFTHGYGLGVAMVDDLVAKWPDLRERGLLITVDNGIAAHAGVAAARAYGMRVIVTDHHLPGASLPAADAIVNPNAVVAQSCGHGAVLCGACAEDLQSNAAFPAKSLAGVGVMFYLLLGLRAHLRRKGWFGLSDYVPICTDTLPPRRRQIEAAASALQADDRVRAATRGEPDLTSLLDLVAVGTVADLVPLDRNNRILVAAGLRRIRAGFGSPGVVALLECGKRDFKRCVASDLGFVVAPRINAAGRLDDIALGIQCLLTADRALACELAERLSVINSERRELQSDMVETAEASVREWIVRRENAALPVGLVLFETHWHHGVVGLVASKLKETLNRPVIACAPALYDALGIESELIGGALSSTHSFDACGDAHDQIKASGRSIPGFHLRDALAEVASRAPGLLQRFGGHAMAAGMSLRRGDIERLRQEFDDIARSHIVPAQLDALLHTDGELQPAEFALDIAARLRDAGPWGQAFPEPLFDGVFEVESWRVVAEKHLRLQLRHAGVRLVLEAMHFNAYSGSPPPSRIRAAFGLDINDWNGRDSLRLTLRHVEAA